jgi:hypothetical protein
MPEDRDLSVYGREKLKSLQVIEIIENERVGLSVQFSVFSQ